MTSSAASAMTFRVLFTYHAPTTGSIEISENSGEKRYGRVLCSMRAKQECVACVQCVSSVCGSYFSVGSVS